MKKSPFLKFCIVAFAAIGINVAAQNAPENYAEPPTFTAPPPAQNELEPGAVNDAPVPNPIYAPNQETTWAPAPEIIMDTPIEQEYVETMPKVQPKRKGLSNGSSEDEYQIDWSAEDLQSQAAIAQTQHRKREIDPNKRANLSALSHVFGALHALRISCQGGADQTYRARMSSMLDMEAPVADYIREPLISAFNSGFSEGGSGQRSCPDDKDVKEALLAKNGYRIAKLMVDYYSANPQ